MKLENIIVAKVDEVPDVYNTMVTKELNISHYMKNPIVLFNFDHEKPPIGRTESLKWENDNLIATMEIIDESVIDMIKNGGHPSIGFTIKHTISESEIVEIVAEDLMTIAICTNKNVDDRILSIKDQLKKGIKNE